MKSLYDSAADRMLALLGIDLDFSIDVHGERFSQITETLYLGARPAAEHVRSLREAGITHVVSVLRADERPKVAFLRADFESLFLNVHDGVRQDIASKFHEFFGFVQEASRNNASAKVLVHCEAGVSRSATLAIALIMQSERKTFFEAYCEVRAKRAQVLPNVGFAAQLQRFERELGVAASDDLEADSLSMFLHQVCNVPVELELLQSALRRHDHDAMAALHAIFGPELPRVVQGVRF